MLKVIFSTFFIYNSIQAYEYIKDKYSYQYEDWLINYSNGFVRRGLIGELLIKPAIYFFHERIWYNYIKIGRK